MPSKYSLPIDFQSSLTFQVPALSFVLAKAPKTMILSLPVLLQMRIADLHPIVECAAVLLVSIRRNPPLAVQLRLQTIKSWRTGVSPKLSLMAALQPIPSVFVAALMPVFPILLLLTRTIVNCIIPQTVVCLLPSKYNPEYLLFLSSCDYFQPK